MESDKSNLHKELVELKESTTLHQSQQAEVISQLRSEQEKLSLERTELQKEVTNLREVEVVRLTKENEEVSKQNSDKEKQIHGNF